MPFWGTCMGLIVAAHDVADLEEYTLDLLDVTVRRNAFGRQIASAEVPLDVSVLGSPSRSPRCSFARRGSSGPVPASRFWPRSEGHGVFVRQAAVIGTAFHPELTGDDRLHAYFASSGRRDRAGGEDHVHPGSVAGSISDARRSPRRCADRRPRPSRSPRSMKRPGSTTSTPSVRSASSCAKQFDFLVQAALVRMLDGVGERFARPP